MADVGSRLSAITSNTTAAHVASAISWSKLRLVGTTGRTVSYYVTHEAQDLYGHEDNPVRRVLVGGQTIRRRIDVSDDKLDFPILHDLKAEGATDYFALPIKSSFGSNYMATFVTARSAAFPTRKSRS